MNLKSFGCSFIFGTELADANDGTTSLAPVPSCVTWPAKLAGHLKYKYECYARPGSGNLQILEQILNQASVSNSLDLFVIGWTWIDRFDYYNPEYNPKDKTIPWSTIMPIDESDLAKMYYRDLHSEYRDKFTCLSYIKLAIDTLNQKGIPFIMTYMDELLFDQQWHTSQATADLQQYIKPCMTKFEDQSFLDWSRNHGYPETEAWHPLEDAHHAAGDYMIKVFDKQNIIGLGPSTLV
jgi:hypothetical protein